MCSLLVQFQKLLTEPTKKKWITQNVENSVDSNSIDFWSKVLTLKKDDQVMKPFLMIVKICLWPPFSNAALERLFSQLNLIKKRQTSLVMTA